MSQAVNVSPAGTSHELSGPSSPPRRSSRKGLGGAAAEKKEGPPPRQQCEKYVPGAHGTCGWKVQREKHVRENTVANPSHHVSIVKTYSAQEPESEERQIGRAESSVVFCADDSAEIKIGAGLGRSPQGWDCSRAERTETVGLARGSGPGRDHHPRSNMNSVPTKPQVSTAQLAQPHSGQR